MKATAISIGRTPGSSMDHVRYGGRERLVVRVGTFPLDACMHADRLSCEAVSTMFSAHKFTKLFYGAKLRCHAFPMVSVFAFRAPPSMLEVIRGYPELVQLWASNFYLGFCRDIFC